MATDLAPWLLGALVLGSARWLLITATKVDLALVKEIVSLQRRCANNFNQIAVRVNTCGGVYPEEIKVLQKDYEDLWGRAPNCWRNFRSWCCKGIRPRSVSGRAADKRTSDHSDWKSQAGLGAPQ